MFWPRSSICSGVRTTCFVMSLRRSHGSSSRKRSAASNVAPPQHSSEWKPTSSMVSRMGSMSEVRMREAQWATRMRTSDMLPILETMDEVGFHSLECWGGATFDAALRFLDEDPWERLRLIKKHVVRAPLQMLLRGQNIVGYRHYGDDIVRRFVYKAAENGMDIFRVFDALNDIRNFETAAAAIKETGKHFQGAVVYTISPVHSLDH